MSTSSRLVAATFIVVAMLAAAGLRGQAPQETPPPAPVQPPEGHGGPPPPGQTPPSPEPRDQRFPAQQRPPADPAVIERGRGLYAGACGACHGVDARGGQLGGPNLLRSQLVLNDQNGELILPVVRNGRPGTIMAPMPMSAEDVTAIAAYLHSLQARGDAQGAPPPGPPVELNILVGNARAGEKFFAANCSGCHSRSGDLAGLASRVTEPKALQTEEAKPMTARHSIAAAALTAILCAAAACGAAGAPEPERVFVSNETAGTVDIVDPAAGRVENQIAVGKRPRGLRLSRDGTRLFVALSGSPIAPPGVDESTLPPPDRAADGIGVVDLATRTLLRTYPSGQDPEAFDLSPDGTLLYVSNEETAEMSVLDLQRGAVTARVPVGEEPEGVTVRPDGRVVYVTCEADNTVVAVDTTTLKAVARIPTAPRPRSIVFTPDGRTMFVTGETGAALTVVEVATHEVVGTVALTGPEEAPTPPRPMGAVLSRDATRLFVSNGRARSVAVIDVATRRQIRTIADVGTRPWGIGISHDGRKLYTANGPSGDVSIVDLESGNVERRVALGGSPWGIEVSPPR